MRKKERLEYANIALLIVVGLILVVLGFYLCLNGSFVKCDFVRKENEYGNIESRRFM